MAQNFLLQSSNLSSASWTKQAGTVPTIDQAIAPDGTMTADLVDVSAASAGTGFYQLTTYAGPLITTITRSVWLKGVVGGEIVTIQDTAYSITPKTCVLTTEWKRFDYPSASSGVGLSCGLWVMKVSGNQFYFWGAQLVNANWAGDYQPTTTAAINTGRPRDIVLKQNRFAYSEDFSQVNWIKNGVTLTANQLDPFNTTKATKLVCTSVLNVKAIYGGSYIGKAGQIFTASCYAKQGEKKYLQIADVGAGAMGSFVVDLSTGLVTQNTLNLANTVVLQPNGFYFVSVTAPAGITGSGVAFIVSDASTAGNAGTAWTGNNVDGLYIFGTQVVNANWAGDYQPTVGTAITNPIRDIVKGQNLLPYSLDYTNHWTNAACSTVANSANSTAPDKSNTAVELKEDGSLSLRRVVATATETIGKVYTFSVFLKAGTRTFAMLQCNSGNSLGSVNLLTGETLNGNASSFIKSTLLNDGWLRVELRTLIDTGGNVYIYPSTGLNFGDTTFQGINGNISMYLWHSQVVQANWSGNYTPTVGTAITNPIRDIVKNSPTVIVDGDMELAGVANWITSFGVATKSAITPYSGAQCLRITAVGGTSAQVYQTGKLVVGRKYRVTGRVRGDGLSGSANVILGVGGIITPVGNFANTWQYFEMSGICTGSTVLYLYSVGHVNNTGYVEYDNLVVQDMTTNPVRSEVLKQNLLPNSSDLTAISWTKVGTPTITPNQLDPENKLTAFNVTSANTTTYIQQAVGRALKIGSAYYTSIYLKADADCSIGLEFIDIGDGNPAYSITPSVKTYWQRFDIPTPILGATASAGAMGIIIGSRFAAWPVARTITMWQPSIVEANWSGDMAKTIGTIIDNSIRNVV